MLALTHMLSSSPSQSHGSASFVPGSAGIQSPAPQSPASSQPLATQSTNITTTTTISNNSSSSSSSSSFSTASPFHSSFLVSSQKIGIMQNDHNYGLLSTLKPTSSVLLSSVTSDILLNPATVLAANRQNIIDKGKEYEPVKIPKDFSTLDEDSHTIHSQRQEQQSVVSGRVYHEEEDLLGRVDGVIGDLMILTLLKKNQKKTFTK
ncbi:hypothetical protein F4703DRAFT_1166846 [Phycomyces blakesleeanus]